MRVLVNLTLALLLAGCNGDRKAGHECAPATRHPIAHLTAKLIRRMSTASLLARRIVASDQGTFTAGIGAVGRGTK
jgi:hypothetical protein